MSSMSMATTVICDAWLVEDDRRTNPSLLPSAEALFLIQIYSQVPPLDSILEGTDTSTASSAPILKEFRLERDYLLHNTSSWSTMLSIFTDMNIPMYVHPILIQKIIQCAQDCRDMDRKVIPMVVHLSTIHAMFSSVSDAFLESLSSQRLMFVGASKSEIEATLEKVEVQDFSTQCAICLEDVPIGTEATCMPCKHIYHGSCISNWLQKSNRCPLCRYQITN